MGIHHQSKSLHLRAVSVGHHGPQKNRHSQHDPFTSTPVTRLCYSAETICFPLRRGAWLKFHGFRIIVIDGGYFGEASHRVDRFEAPHRRLHIALLHSASQASRALSPPLSISFDGTTYISLRPARFKTRFMTKRKLTSQYMALNYQYKYINIMYSKRYTMYIGCYVKRERHIRLANLYVVVIPI